MIEEKRIRVKQLEKMLNRLTECLKVGLVVDTLKATRDRHAWKAIRYSGGILVD